jgi:hypothetical protein
MHLERSNPAAANPQLDGLVMDGAKGSSFDRGEEFIDGGKG